MPDFADMYANVDAVTDSPANHFVEEIFHTFPDAKVLLMLRDDEDVWLKSFMETIDVWNASIQLWFIFGFVFTPTGRKLRRLLDNQYTKIWKSANKKDSDYKEVFKSVYREHNELVRAVIPRDKLLVFNVKQGWKPLCEFLAVEVPDVPFPRSNVNSEAIPDLMNFSNVGKRMFQEVIFMLTVMVIVLAATVFMVLVQY
jgi:hypothetical protein